MRQMSFAVHGSSELSLTGAAFALLTGLNVGVGALVGSALAAVLFGILGQRARERDSAIGVVLAFGLGLAVLFIHLYPGRTGTSFALLTGQIVGVGYSGLALLAVVTAVVIVVLAVCYRPLLFATVDPEVAAARGVPVRAMGIVFAALVGVVAAQGVQIVGALLVMSLLITPAAAAARVFVSPAATIVASVVFAEISAVGGIVLSLAPGVPVSVFVTTISFAIFLVCWLVGSVTRTTRRTNPFSTGRVGSEHHSDHEPGYSAASMPSVCERGDDDRRGDAGAAIGADVVDVAEQLREIRSPGTSRPRPESRCSARCRRRECVLRPDRSARHRRGIARVPAHRAGCRRPSPFRPSRSEARRRRGPRGAPSRRRPRVSRSALELAGSRPPTRRRGCGHSEMPAAVNTHHARAEPARFQSS